MDTMTRKAFDALPHHERLAAIRKFKIIPDAAEAPRYAGPNEIARVQWEALEPGAKADLLRSGVRIVDAGIASVATMGGPGPGFVPSSDGAGWVRADAP